MDRSKRLTIMMMVLTLLLVATTALVLAQTQPVIVPLGLLTAADSSAGRGAQLAIAEINSSGGIVGPGGKVYAFELLSVPVTTPDEVRAALVALQEREVAAILGPDDTDVVLATFNNLRGLRVPILTAATGDTLTIADPSNYLFRSRAPEQVYVQAIVDYLVSVDAQPVVAIVQADTAASTTESVVGFTAALGSRGVFPLTTLQVAESQDFSTVQATLANLNPDVVAMWGAPDRAADLLAELRGAGWEGAYFYRQATDRAFREAVFEQNLNTNGGILGVTSWTPGIRDTASDNFLISYTGTFGSVPDELSAAAYDAVYLLSSGVAAGGSNPAAIQQGLQQINRMVGVQGVFAPSEYLVGETTNAAAIVELNSYVAPQVLSLYMDGELVPNEAEVISLVTTPQPTAPVFTPTPAPTATPEGVWATVDTFRLNIRTGPGTNYEVMGQFQVDDVIFPVGANADFSWLVVPYRGTTGWIASYLVDLNGDRNSLPIIVPPPSPTPEPTLTPTPVPFADLVVVSAVIEPAMPISGQPFVVRVTVQNTGNVNTFETAIAASFMPGEVYTSAPIPSLGPGQTVTVTLNPTVTGTGSYTVELVLDLNDYVNEAGGGEANNIYPIAYTLNHAIVLSGSHSLTPPLQEHDLMASGTPILRWDGTTFSAINGAFIAILPGLNFNSLSYGQLTGITGTSIPRASLVPGTVVGLITAPEGYRGALRIDSYAGDTIRYSFQVYSP